jgi:hypothetical protein
VAAGSLSTRLGIEEGTPLPRSIIEFYYKKDELGDPMVAEEHITAFNWATTQEIDDIMALTLRINDYPLRACSRRRHQAGGLQARVRPPLRGRHGAHRFWPTRSARTAAACGT